MFADFKRRWIETIESSEVMTALNRRALMIGSSVALLVSCGRNPDSQSVTHGYSGYIQTVVYRFSGNRWRPIQVFQRHPVYSNDDAPGSFVDGLSQID
jgi:hypothetical protein